MLRQLPLVEKLDVFFREKLDFDPAGHLVKGRVFLVDLNVHLFEGRHHLGRWVGVQLKLELDFFMEIGHLVPAVFKRRVEVVHLFEIDVSYQRNIVLLVLLALGINALHNLC